MWREYEVMVPPSRCPALTYKAKLPIIYLGICNLTPPPVVNFTHTRRKMLVKVVAASLDMGTAVLPLVVVKKLVGVYHW